MNEDRFIWSQTVIAKELWDDQAAFQAYVETAHHEAVTRRADFRARKVTGEVARGIRFQKVVSDKELGQKMAECPEAEATSVRITIFYDTEPDWDQIRIFHDPTTGP